MIYLLRAVSFLLLLFFSNCVYLFYVLPWNVALKILALAGLALFYLCYHIWPRRARQSPASAMRRLLRGREAALMSLALLAAEIGVILWVVFTHKSSGSTAINIISPLFAAAMILLLMLNGVLRMVTSSGQLGVTRRSLLIFLWWVPVLGQVLLVQSCITALREYRFNSMRAARIPDSVLQAISRS